MADCARIGQEFFTIGAIARKLLVSGRRLHGLVAELTLLLRLLMCLLLSLAASKSHDIGLLYLMKLLDLVLDLEAGGFHLDAHLTSFLLQLSDVEVHQEIG